MKKRQLSLRFTVLAVVGPVLFAFLLGFLIVVQFSTSNILIKAEDKYLDQQRILVEGFLDGAMQNAYGMADDMAVWDETVAFVRGENPGYLAENWPEVSILKAYGFHFILFKDAEGQDVYTDYYNPVSGRPETEPEGFSAAMADMASPLTERYAGGMVPYDTLADLGLGGIYFYDGQAYFVAAMPITSNRGVGPSQGTVILGNRLDQEYLRNVTYLTDIDFSVVAQGQNAEPGDDTASVGVSRQNSREVSTAITLSDWQGRPVTLTLSHSRDIYADGVGQAGRTALVLLAAMMVFIVVLYLIVSRKVLTPFERLSHDISTTTMEDGIDPAKYSNSREFVALCSAIDGLMMVMRQSSISINAFESILNGIDAYVYVSDPDTSEMLFVNNKMGEGYGTREELVGRPCWQTLQQGFDGPCPFCPVPYLLENPGDTVTWAECNTRTGRHYDNSDRLIPWTDGRMVHLQLGIDVTEMYEAQETLKRRLEQQELMSAMAQSFISKESVDVLIHQALDMTGNFINAGKIVIAAISDDHQSIAYRYGWNNVATGVAPPSQAVMPFAPGTPMYDFFIDQRLPYVSCSDVELDPRFFYLKAFKVRAVLILPIYVDNAFWGCINIDTMDRPYAWTDSDISLMRLIVSVISGAISRSNMENQLIAAKEHAEEMSRAKSDFLSRMSHEMRTPMNAIIGMTAIAQGSGDIERKDYCLDKVAGASKHLLGVINDILDMSKIESGKFELSESEFDFERMLMKVAGVIGFRVDEKHQNLTFRIDPGVPRFLMGDEQRLNQVITNLLSNASKFTPEQGGIAVEARVLEEDGDDLILQMAVSDTGIGISQEQQSKLFRSFEQADGGISRRFGGTGLGLSISKSIVEMMGGEIWIESELGHGATFIFTARLRRSRRSPKSILPEGTSWSNLRVLVVDDAPEVREYFITIAQSLGLQCDTAADGFEACRILDENQADPYGIVFVDWRMPGMDGIELTRKIKNEYSDQTVVIMISSADWGIIEHDAKAAGVDKYLAKPLFPSVIADCINECMGITALEDERVEEAVDMTGRYAGCRILLAEDIEINREIVQAILEPTGVIIDSAENGSIALSMFLENPERYDLIFMDIHMPEMDGFEATRRIRALDIPAARAVPIIAMTANVFREDIDRCLAAGMNDHVGKPLEVSEVFDRMNRYLR